MNPTRTALLLLLNVPVISPAAAQTVILHDGIADEWPEIPAIATDNAGEVSAPDLVSLKATDDGEALILLLEYQSQRGIQTNDPAELGNRTVLLLDGDADPQTGDSQQGLGVDLEIRFGDRDAVLYSAGGNDTAVSLNDIGAVSLPTHTSEFFEIRIPFGTWQSGDTVRAVLRDEDSGDRLPADGFAEYTLAGTAPPPVEPITLERAAGTDVRFLVWNVERTSPATNPDPFVRVLEATEPDIVMWNEVYPAVWSDQDILNFFSANYPPPGGGSWNLRRENDTVTLSPWPVTGFAPLSGNHVVRVDVPDDLSPHDLVLFNVHTPCCANNAGRDFEHDEISAAWRDLLNGTGPFAAEPDDVAVMAGDFNMVGFRRQLETLRDGDIIDNGTFGPDFDPGRAEGSLEEITTRHTHSRATYTWIDLPSNFAPGRLDWIFFSGDYATALKAYALYTPEVPADVLSAAGLQADDSIAADHLPLVLDLQLGAETVQSDLWQVGDGSLPGG